MRIILAFVFICSTVSGFAQFKSARELVHKMYVDVKENPMAGFTFRQETIRYRTDTLSGDTSTWYEAIQYPDKFRIDFGDPAEGNAVLYKNDSAYIFKGGQLDKSRFEPMPLLFLEGGMAFYPFKAVMPRLQELGLDTSILSKQDWMGKSYWVLGAKPGDLNARQVWVDANSLMPIRRLDPHPSGKTIELVYKNFKDFDGHQIETRVDIFVEGKFIQKEFYHDIDPNPSIPEDFFEPSKFGASHWLKN
ncbi:MAG: hypothetical protein KDC24_14020 [Saprospiraceae bacterium]|nr:hypothetical protein [Saprospiraceae bacterium]